jgi:hypothetical protein
VLVLRLDMVDQVLWSWRVVSLSVCMPDVVLTTAVVRWNPK